VQPQRRVKVAAKTAVSALSKRTSHRADHKDAARAAADCPSFSAARTDIAARSRKA